LASTLKTTNFCTPQPKKASLFRRHKIIIGITGTGKPEESTCNPVFGDNAR
jgi:hypothetical protein